MIGSAYPPALHTFGVKLADQPEMGPLGAILSQREFPNQAYAAYVDAVDRAAHPDLGEQYGYLDVRMVAVGSLPGFAQTPAYKLSGMVMDGIEPPLRSFDTTYVELRDTVSANVRHALARGTMRVEVLLWEHLLTEKFDGMREQIALMRQLQHMYDDNLSFRLIPQKFWRYALGLTMDRIELRAPATWPVPLTQIISTALDHETMLPQRGLRYGEPQVDRYLVWREAFSGEIDWDMLLG